MAYLDYSPVVLPDHSEGIRQLGDALTEVMKRREQRRQFEKTQEFQREQENRKFAQAQMNNDYQNRIIDARERRDQVEFNRRQDQDNATAMERARKAASPQEAEAILSNTHRYDPATGRDLGTGKLSPGQMQDIGPAPAAPEMPGMPPEIAARFRGKRGGVMPSPEPGAFVGPIPSAEETRNAEEERQTFEAGPDTDVKALLNAAEAERKVQLEPRERYVRQFNAYREENPEPTIGPTAADAGYDQALDKFEADQASLPGRQAEHAAATRRAEASRPYTMSLPGQPDVTFDFETQRFAARNDAADRFLASLPSGMTDDDKQAAAQIHAGIKSGTIDPSKAGAMFQRERIGATEREFKGGEGDANRASREKIAAMMANRPRSSPTATGNLDMRQFEQFQKDAERFAKRYGVPADINGMKQLNDGLRGIGGDNAALQRGVAFQIARSMQGVGPLTQQDIERIATDIAGKGGTLESFVQKATTGHLGDAEKKVFFDAIKIRTAGLQQRMQGARNEAEAHFLSDKSPYRKWVGDDFIMSELNAMFPGTTSSTSAPAEPTGGPPEVGARRKGKKAAKAATSKDDEAMQ